MGLAFESQRNHIKKAVSSEGTAFFMEIFKKDLSISGAMEKILSISINLSRWIVKGFLGQRIFLVGNLSFKRIA